MPEYSTLAAVDLGSNSFRLQVARVEGRQLYPLDNLREMVRLAAGLTPDKRLDEDSQARALACLKRFSERLRGFPPMPYEQLRLTLSGWRKMRPYSSKKPRQRSVFPLKSSRVTKRHVSSIWALRTASLLLLMLAW